ncbi:HECT-domain-containing protein [Dentipellis sp. KUC8613]|nr:HECT-domain-containing protein [Dentipellis sp. KUC8613]
MIPIFGDEKRRKINLGGARSVSTHEAVLSEAKALRSERQNLRRRQESAIQIQAWWRGCHEARAVRRNLVAAFRKDVRGLNGLRCLVLVGSDQDVLGEWSAAMVEQGEDWFLKQAVGEDSSSWLVLIRQVGILLLQSVAEKPQSRYALNHLRVLELLLSPAKTTRALGPESALSVNMSEYFLDHGLFQYLSTAISHIPVEAKAEPALPLLVSLHIFPLSNFSSSHPGPYSQALAQTFLHLLTLPLLPNRLPLASLSELSARLPFSSVSIIAAFVPDLVSTSSTEGKIHLIANLIAFMPPRYAKLSAASLEAYLSLLSALMNSLPTHALEPPSPGSAASKGKRALDSDSDSDSEAGPELETTAPAPVLPQLDSRTLKRLQTLPSISHISMLSAASQRHAATRPRLYDFLFALCTVWPARVDGVLGALVASTGGGLVRELYRGYVRTSPLGRDDNASALMDPAYASQWPALLLLTDLYHQTLLTMGDDEFFGTARDAGAARNPLTLDELISFSRKLLNIAFTLYWREDQTNVQEGAVPGVNVKWIDVREKVTRCLLAIHARDSRKPFTPPDHWLVTSQIDLTSFIEAAIIEEMQLLQPPGARPLTKRQVSYLSPRLGVLHNIPFAIPFDVRVMIFRSFVASDMQSHGAGGPRAFLNRRNIVIRRGHIAEDGFNKLSDVDLKKPLEISFIDQFGKEEAGIDGGGVFKEFFTALCKEVFDTNRGLWLTNKHNELYPNPHSYATETHNLAWYSFIGRILGKALYEGILVDVVFAGFFLAKWLGKQSFLDDLASLDPELYQGLIFLKHYTGNPEELSLTFAVTEDEFGVAKTVDLCPNGSNIPVTKENRLSYIYRISHYRLTKQIKLQSEAFFEGLSEMIDPKWLRMFNQQELQILLGGVNAPIDLDDLRSHTNYGGLYDDHEPTIVAFWNVVNSFDQEQRRALLRFVTSVGRPPLLGFKELIPNFSIRDAGSDQERLPTSSTCVNLLKLPRYKSERTLREKLLQAIFSGAGFDLS